MTAWCLLAAPEGARSAIEPLAAALASRADFDRVEVDGAMLLLTQGQVPWQRLDAGVLLGHVFGAPLAADAERWPADDDGARFVRRHWGAYVAVRRSPAGIEVLRDPSGMAPCYRIRLGPVWLLTDAPRCLHACGIVTPSVDWQAVVTALVRRDWRSERTALTGIDELRPGTVTSLGAGDATCRRLWDASQHSALPPGRDLSPEALAETIDRCMADWARVYRRPLIEISGGLDSAVVAAALARYAETPHLVTFAAGPGDPTELGYAEAIASRLGLALAITHPRVEDVDLVRSHAADLPRPNARAFTQAADAWSRAHAVAVGADAFASGGGGDDLFGYRQSIAPAVDRLRTEGPGWGVIRTLDDLARMSHATLWEALGRFMRRIVVRPPPPDRTDTRLLAAEAGRWTAAIDAAEAPRPAALPGKAAHVRAIATLPNHLEGHGRAATAPVLFPLLSQPIVEFCLAVPSWHWCAGGVNRALARRAFADRLPGCVIERRSKGAFDGFCARLFDRNRAQVATMLLDGALAQHAILDRDAVTAAIRNPAPSGELVMRLLALVDVEAWLHCWTDVPAHAPPAPASVHIAPASPVPGPRAR